jgi:hypothetical protein
MTHPLKATGQTGSISITVPLVALTVLVLVGFTFDAGNAITAHRRAVNLAEQAARAAAAAYLTSTDTSGQVQLGRDADGDYVQVVVDWTQPALFAGLLGRSRFTGTARGRAHNCHGLVREEGC